MPHVPAPGPHTRFRGSRLMFAEALTLAALLILPFLVQDALTVFMTRVLLLCLLALSFDLAWGYGGIMSFGQALYFGSAGYAGSLLAREFGIGSLVIILPVAVVVGMALAAAVGALILLAKRPPALIVIALGSLSGAYIAERLVRGWYWLGGQNGIAGLPYPELFGHEVAEGRPYYLLALVALLIAYLVARILVRSQFGLSLAAARQNETRTLFLGAPVQTMKLLAFTLAGGIAGLGGGLFAFHEGFVGPVVLGVALSTRAVVSVLLGGAGTLIGAVLGTIGIEIAGYLLADRFADVWPILLGGILLAVVVIQPAGLVGLFTSAEARMGHFGPRRALRRPAVKANEQ